MGWEWDGNGNSPTGIHVEMGIRPKLKNWNGKEWESTAWYGREWGVDV